MAASTEYVLLAEVFYLRQEGGRRVKFRRGDVVSGLSHAQVQRLLRIRAIGPRVTDEPVDVQPPAAPPADDRPGEDATKDELIDWLVANAVDEDGDPYSRSRLQRMNKAALADLVDSMED